MDQTYRKANGAWHCPEGYAAPKCPGCGHNFFEDKPRPKQANGNSPNGGLCHWCVEELIEADRG